MDYFQSIELLHYLLIYIFCITFWIPLFSEYHLKQDPEWIYFILQYSAFTLFFSPLEEASVHDLCVKH